MLNIFRKRRDKKLEAAQTIIMALDKYLLGRSDMDRAKLHYIYTINRKIFFGEK